MAIPRAKLNVAALDALMGTTAITPPEAPAERTRFVYKARDPQEFTASPQQADFFAWVQNGRGSCLLEAVAGSGKTTTLIRALAFMQGSVFFGAYNKKIAIEIKEKVAKARLDRQGLFISTMHGAGYSAWMRAYPKSQVSENKVNDIIKGMAQDDESIKHFSGFVRKMVSFGKQFLIGFARSIHDDAFWGSLVDRFDMLSDLPEGGDSKAITRAMELVKDVYQRSIKRCSDEIDFDDMIFAPIYYNLRLFQNDWVLIDERQDTNPARRELAKRMLKPFGRLVAVGDTNQAIYGFTGADGDAQRFVEDFRCITMPLTVTYRCPKAVAAFAQQWVTHIQAHPSAPEGVVRTPIAWQRPTNDPNAKEPAWYLREALTPQDAILCRYTRPLVATAFAMLRQGLACRVEGRDIGNGLKKLATRWQIGTLDALEKKLADWLAAQIKAADGNEGLIEKATDLFATLHVFIERCREQGQRRITDLVAEIDRLFADDVKGVTTLSTIHKSKGREFPRVYWLQIKSRRQGLKDWQIVEEDNLCYVATTRAQAELILVPEENGK